MPDLEWIKANTDVEVAEIAQTYLGMKENGFGDRVRKMTIDGETKYYYTSKKSVSSMSRIEIESEISKEEYDNFLDMLYGKFGKSIVEKFCEFFKNKKKKTAAQATV